MSSPRPAVQMRLVEGIQWRNWWTNLNDKVLPMAIADARNSVKFFARDWMEGPPGARGSSHIQRISAEDSQQFDRGHRRKGAGD